ncbi:LCP family protein [Saccharopolyspora flava]|uniref:Transcriptional attenuator, LytR family n=1 Tax=Saccharopolyspora flava TaxID=95161 RepID=A0A1I6RKJ0_9PSEU|nr:LCP family protein [Saccharopolyspora flava]SFS65164.1 transcriptional attenuator, LytR family [Saccharopolyspora flava]
MAQVGRRARPDITATTPLRSLRPTRRRSVAARAAVALSSALVLLLTGFGWSLLGDLGGSTSSANDNEPVDVLLVGMDGRTDAQGNPLPPELLRELRTEDSGSSLTDTVMLLHVSADRTRAVAHSLPRDSYVAVPGHGSHKLNAAYGIGKAQERRRLQSDGVDDQADLERLSSDAGRDLLVRTVHQLTGVDINHVAEVNLLGFYELTTAIGGVEVCLNQPVDDPYSGARFAAGRQEVSGGDALAFVRQRHGLPRGDLDRVQRQQAFLAGFAERVLSAGTLTSPAKLQRLLNAVERSVVLDDDWDVLGFAGDLTGLAGGNIQFGTIPVADPEYDTPDGQAVKVLPQSVRRAIARANEGPPPPPSKPADLETTTVEIFNGTSTTGMAARAEEELRDGDVVIGHVGNGPETTESRVLHHPNDADVAEYVSGLLGSIPTAVDPSLPMGNVRVLQGKDYDDPENIQEFAPRAPIRLDGQQAPLPTKSGITADEIPCVN